LSAFLLPHGAPDPGAPPCIRQRRLPLTAGDRQGRPERVFAPQRKLARIGPASGATPGGSGFDCERINDRHCRLPASGKASGPEVCVVAFGRD